MPRGPRHAMGRGALALLIILSCGAGAARGQDQDTSQQTTDQSKEATQKKSEEKQTDEEKLPNVLSTITVTAQKREQNPKDVPESLTTMSDEEVATLSAGGADVKFLSGHVPSLMIESSFGRAFPRFYIRGLGNTDFDLNASQPVSMVYDDVVLENPILKGMPVWDVDHVEVLRGPQGTLFGRNTPAGIVKFDSKKPTRDKESYVNASWGTYNTIDAKAAISGPLTDTLSARVSLLFQSRSDWVDNGFTGKNNALGGYDNNAYRVQFLWQPNDRFSGLLNVHGWNVDGTARIFRANIIKPGTNDLISGFQRDKVYQDGLNKQTIHSHGGVLKFDYDFDFATLTSVTGYETLNMYSRGDIDGGYGDVSHPPYGPGFIPFYSETADGLPDLNQFTQEFRLASKTSGDYDWLIGAYYFDEDLKAQTFSYTSVAPGNPQEGYAFQKQNAHSWALFGSANYRPTDRWNLQAGLRYTSDKKDFSAERPEPVFQTPTFAPIKKHTNADFTSWDASATYKATDDTNVYGRIATSFRAPSIQGRILFCPDFEGGLNPATNCVSVADREDILSYEVGTKSELLDNRLRVNAAVYTYQLNGEQIVAVGGQYNTATLLNADKTNGYGFETGVDIAPNRHWLTTLGVSYNHTEIKDKNLSVAPCGGGCTVLDPIGPNGAMVNGNSLPHAPEWIVNGIVDYRTEVGGSDNLIMASLDWAYSSDKSFFLYESKEFHSDSFELGLRLGYLFHHGRYEVSLYGRNITDAVVIQNGIDFDNLTGMVNEPRIIGVGFGLHVK